MKSVDVTHFDDAFAQNSITGMIMPAEGPHGIGIRVQAFARSMPSIERRPGSEPQLVGEAITNREGQFHIAYIWERFKSGEVAAPDGRIGSPNVSFRVFNQAGQELTIKFVTALDREFRGDQIIFNVPAQLQASIEVEAPSPPAADSEYEQLIATLSPVIKDVPLAELSDEDVAFIYEQLKIEAGSMVPQRIAWLRRSAWLERETHLATKPSTDGAARTYRLSLLKWCQSLKII